MFLIHRNEELNGYFLALSFMCLWLMTNGFFMLSFLIAWSPNLECRPYRFDKLLCGKFMLRFQVLHSGKKEILVWLLLHSWYLKRKTKSLFDPLITVSWFKIREVLVTSPSLKPFFLLLLVTITCEHRSSFAIKKLIIS